jgi:hypothetical protein
VKDLDLMRSCPFTIPFVLLGVITVSVAAGVARLIHHTLRRV